MKRSEVQKIIEHEIPITKAMGIEFQDFQDTSCLISVPLAPNHNHKGTAFGGSLYSACAAACYGILYYLQVKHKLSNYDLLLASGSINYAKPVQKDFQIKASLLSEDWNQLTTKLSKQGFGKIQIVASVFTDDEQNPLCEFSGIFVLKTLAIQPRSF